MDRRVMEGRLDAVAAQRHHDAVAIDIDINLMAWVSNRLEWMERSKSMYQVS